MTNEEFQNQMKDIQDKIGEENSALIMDNIGLLITDNLNMNDSLKAKDTEIANQKARNESLLQVNGNLLQQVSIAEEPKKRQEQKEEPKKAFDFREAFDEYGNFKK